jgi:zinc/manganese transport system permease protein
MSIELGLMAVAFLACLVISLMHVYLGLHVISRKVIFVDLALAQIAAVGATYATTLGYDPASDSFKVSLFSLAFTFVGAVAFSIARMRKEKVPQEAFIGIIYAAASALAILLLSKSASGGEELKHMLVGDILLVSKTTVWHVGLLYAVIGVFHFIFRKKFLAISLDPDAAEASGINIRFWDILFYMSFGIVITKSVGIAGVLLVFSYLVVPAVVAQMWFDSVRSRLFMGWAVALIASILGILWSFHSDYPTGPAIVVTLFLSLITSSIVYYVRYAPSKAGALLRVAGIAAFGFLFFTGLSYFKKPVEQTNAKLSPVEILIRELKDDEEAHQLDAIQHLGEMQDPRIVPALAETLTATKSEQVVESIAEALGKQKDPRAISALQAAAQHPYDDFLKFTIAKAQLAIGDKNGIQTLIAILKNDQAEPFARQQAMDLMESVSGKKFAYKADQPVANNSDALKQIDDWWKVEGSKLKLSPKS